MSVLPFNQRREWLLSEIAKEGRVDILNSNFVIGYADHTGAKYKPSFVGAGWCGLLSRDLARMAKLRLLKRQRCGLSAYEGGPGFPRWYYSYMFSPIGFEWMKDMKNQVSGGDE